MQANYTQNKDWEPPRVSQQTLAELIEKWFVLHGQYLKDGASRQSLLNNLCKRWGNPKAEQIDAAMFTAYRASRASEVTPNTLNHEMAYLKAVFNELIRLGEWTKDNPLKSIRPLKLDDPELTYLSTDQINLLLASLAKRRSNALKVAKVCLSTGARWSEAEGLMAGQVKPYRITYNHTKSGKSRSIPITPELYNEIKTREEGRLFTGCYDSFTNALRDTGLELPKGQRTHVLRHTFASHFIMNGGNLLTLQKILGHQSIQMTMRYAHLAPDHLEEAVRFNPIGYKS